MPNSSDFHKLPRLARFAYEAYGKRRDRKGGRRGKDANPRVTFLSTPMELKVPSRVDVSVWEMIAMAKLGAVALIVVVRHSAAAGDKPGAFHRVSCPWCGSTLASRGC